ncbi:MAG: class I SAM-dependent methyltransferase [Actinomycetota bacterium]
MDERAIAECFDREAGCCSEKTRRRRRSRDQPLADALAATGIQGKSVLEIGCGVGVLSLELARRGFDSVRGIDLSPESVATATSEARADGLAEKVRFEVGNGATDPLEPRDVVVLDRVLCCYPRAQELITHTLEAARQEYAFTLPRNEGALRYYWQAGFGIENAYHALRRRRFRAYLHDLKLIDQWLRDQAFSPRQRFSRRGWLHAVYVRSH